MGTALLVLLSALVAVSPASAQSPSASGPNADVHVVTYLDVLPSQADAARALLAQQTSAERSQEGCRSSDLLQEQGRPNHFMLLEAWDNEAALESYHASENYRTFRTKLQPAIGSPLDERRAQRVTVPATNGAPGAR